ncbi:MAG: L-serine ammonia-lyase, iron-sulfur-dependent, subunit alpha [Bacillota bacterium]|nr:L-serine ammonia-lyase, iron-sulfur-dependent, subunit alpha [Bacillota bacterium]
MKKLLIEILKNEVKPAMGCTEPIAVALAAARVKKELGNDDFDKMEVNVSPNFYKNGLAVGIPHTKFIGLDIAALVGFIDGNSDYMLEVLKDVNDNKIKDADKLVDKVKLSIKDTDKSVYIQVIVYSNNNRVEVVIEDKHDNFTLVKKNDDIIFKNINGTNNSNVSIDLSDFYKMKIIDIVREVEKFDFEDIKFMLDGYKMNRLIATEGLRIKHGFGVGYSLNEMLEDGIIGDSLANRASILTAAASDARMAGVNMPVMSSNGSGNNGITAIIPIVAYAESNDVSDEKIAKAIAISHLVNNYIKNEIGRLSAMCSCSVSAGASSSVAIVWLKGGGEKEIEGTINNMIANVSGMICDGAKRGCSIKLATAASLSIINAELALKGSIVGAKNGIVNGLAEKTIRNLGILSREGMKITDSVILDIMQQND